MLRQDFISKIIEQLFAMIAKLIKIDYEKETEKFLVTFNELLTTYFKISPDELNQLMELNENRDAILLDEKLKNAQLSMFSQAGLAFVLQGEIQKAKECLQIIGRIQEQNTQLYDFPSQDQLELAERIEKLKSLTKTRRI